jgi:agmatinase
MSDVLETYSPVLDRDLQDVAVRDLGDLQLDACSVEEALGAIASGMAFAARDARLAVMLGGEHLASLGGFRGIKSVYPDAVILQADAHLDMRPDYEGQALSHATWLNHVGQEFGFQVVHQVGLRSGDRLEWQLARRATAWSSTELSVPRSVRERIGRRPVYISIDIDVLDPAHAPGTGTPEAGGMTSRELLHCLRNLVGANVVGADIVEVAPAYDHAEITGVAAAHVAYELISVLAKS